MASPGIKLGDVAVAEFVLPAQPHRGLPVLQPGAKYVCIIQKGQAHKYHVQHTTVSLLEGTANRA